MTKDEWQRLKQNIKMQRSLVKGGKTPHIRDMARHRLYKLLDLQRFEALKKWGKA
jgi:hypothetical protein